ncbi:winged helix-turn-helix domain-containing protein [Aliikangiella coralliicola]|uniref:OmpR/PhoB-type domain-containing protein n=1 Tax=Aliikangiella coralliicola TaxID=2592383 RepID=A0A545U6Q1_9GAMM|nr:winged helix-turn-helix domain-containing protein [Aliikangiella coralliicola]TQV85083.1 hypothetical protein FLL46_22095 [Aliikangiella coralliicola]
MKLNKFLLEEHQVDVSRNQITINNKVHSLPPRVIAVLCMLAEKQGEVIHIEDLMQTVWEGRVVSANTLQRCISQLRKALNDDASTQRVIKTHSKKGYSLEIPLTPLKPLESEVNDSQINGSELNKPGLTSSGLINSSQEAREPKTVWLISSAILGCLAIALFFWINLSNESNMGALEVNQGLAPLITVTPITSTDDWESAASFQMQGDYIIFQRHIDDCYSNIWLKDISTSKERKLTVKKGIFGKPSWSPDGRYITFTERNSCRQLQTTDELCWSVNSINIIDALSAPQKPAIKVECRSIPTWQPKWLPDGSISFLTENDGNASIQVYSPKTQSIDTLYRESDNYAYDYDFSVAKESFAVLGLNKNHDHTLSVLDVAGNLLSISRIKLPSDFPTDRPLGVQYHSSGEYLIASGVGFVYRLDFDGEISEINLGGRKNLAELSIHPNGQSFVATEFIADTDTILLSKTLIETNERIMNLDIHRLARSNLSDDQPIFQPGGSLIAFTSNRAGNRQIWLSNGEVRQLTKSTQELQSKTIRWSPDGKNISGVIENKVHIWQLDGTYQIINSKLGIESILQWISFDEMLVTAIVNGQSTLHSLNIKTKTMKNLGLKNIIWANYDDKGLLIYLDRNGKLWRGLEKPKEIARLRNQLEQPSVVLRKGVLYGLNNARQLWSYNIASHSFKILVGLPESTRYLSDYNGEDFLITNMAQLKKDLISIEIKRRKNQLN